MGLPLEILKDHLARVLVRLNHLRLADVIGFPETAERMAEYIKKEMPPGKLQIRVQIGDEGYVETE